MKKMNFLMAIGLMSAALMQAQETVVSLGFESGDATYTTEQAYTPGGTYGNWVNRQADDVWTETCTEARTGEYCMKMENTTSHTGNTWDRGFVVGNLSLKDNTSYRVSFWVKAEPTWFDGSTVHNTSLKSSLGIGHEYCDMPISTKSGTQYYNNYTSGMTGDWKHFSYITFFTNKADQDALSEKYTGKEDKNGEIPVAQGDPFPEEYFLIINMYNPGEYFLDDIKIEENVTFNEATFMDDVIKLDFGYPTNIAALARAEGGTLSLDPSLVKVVVDGEEQPVEFLEGKEDGFLYIFLNEVYLDADADVKVSFTPDADCPIVYSGDKRPSADTESELKVIGFADEKAYPVQDIDALPSSWSPAKLVSTNPENESFEIESATFTNISLTYDKALDLSYASATLSKNGFETDLTDAMSLSDDLQTINIAVSGLADGEYTLIVSGVANAMGVECTEDQQIIFAVGADNDDSVSEVVYSTNETFAETENGTFPVGWVANDNGTIHQYGIFNEATGAVVNYNWGGNTGGGGTRAMTGYSGDLNGAAIYWRSMNGSNTLGTLTYGEQVKDYMLADGTLDPDMPEGISLYLDPRKYQITIRMCAWKNLNSNADAVNPENAPKYSFTLEDLSGNVYARFDDVLAMPNVNGAQNISVTGVTRSQTEFTVDQAGYYMLKFSTTQPNGEYLLGGVDLITMPSKAAFWKQQLAQAVAAAEAVLEAADDDIYDGETKTALAAAIENGKTGHFTAPSAVEALVAELGTLGEKMSARVRNIDDFDISLLSAMAAYEELEGKYLNAEIAVEAKEMLDRYAETNASALSDEELAEVSPKLVTAAAQLANVKSVVDVLTCGITKAVMTYGKIGTNDELAFSAAREAATDDRDVANGINLANTARVLQILAEELEDGQIPEAYITKVNEHAETNEDGEQVTVADVEGIELTGLIQNPKLYRELNVDGIPGWTVEAGSEESTLNIAYEGTAPTVEQPVTDQYISVYGNADYNLTQTLVNMPAGIYTVKFSTRTPLIDKTAEFDKVFYYNAQDEEGTWDKYIYAGTEVVPYLGGSWGYGNETNNTYIKDVEVGEDGILVIGAREHYVSGKAEKHEDNSPQDFWTGTTMCDDVRIFLVAPLAGYDYSKAAEAVAIETVEHTAPAAIIGIYTTDGARTAALNRGINIVKYANGTVKKVLVK